MSGEEQGLTSLAVLSGIALSHLLNRETRRWLRRKPTDWNAVRQALGYVAAPDQPAPSASRLERLRRFWPFATNWDRERRRLGYGVTIDARPVRGSKRRSWR